MPELPEVESIRRYLVASNIQGATIQRVEIGWPDSIAAPAADIEAFANKVSNTQIGPLDRRGKYLVSPLIDRNESQSHLVLHMGMTGSLHVRNPDDDPVRYRRAAFYLNDDRRIELNDSRRWARLWAVDDPTIAFPRLGPEPWDLTPDQFADRIRSKRSRIKPTLLDQSLIAGVGNIYADEALLSTGISPVRRCNRISLTRLHQLHTKILAVLEPRPQPHHNPPQPRRQPIRSRRPRRSNAHPPNPQLHLPNLPPTHHLAPHLRQNRLLLPKLPALDETLASLGTRTGGGSPLPSMGAVHNHRHSGESRNPEGRCNGAAHMI